MLRRSLLTLALLCGPALADPAYNLRMHSSLRDGQLTVAPSIAGPAGARLRYEVTSTREGDGNQSSSTQSGTLRLAGEGAVELSSLSVSVTPQDRYVITVKVYEGSKLVASDVLRHP